MGEEEGQAKAAALGGSGGPNPPLAPARPRDSWNMLTAVATLAAALFAGWAAGEAHSTVDETARATRATAWGSLLQEYSQTDMLTSMMALREWQQDKPKKFAEEFQVLYVNRGRNDAKNTFVNSLDAHRRRVWNFFWKVRVLTEGNVIDENFVSEEWGGGTRTFINVVLLPMQTAQENALKRLGYITEEDAKQIEVNRSRTPAFFERMARLAAERLK